jgi:molybdenum cofactor guanylyltransferase
VTTFETSRSGITGLILAGGAGRRAQGRDKGLIHWRGKALVEHVHDRIAPQVDGMLISCNRNREQYARVAEITASDLRDDYQGPLAGLEAATGCLSSAMVLVVPCDTPDLPFDLAQRLQQSLESTPEINVAFARTDDGGQYLCALLRTPCLDTLPAYLDSGQRAVRHWYQELGAVEVNFSEQSGRFTNLNDFC